MAEQAEVAFIKAFLNTLSTQPITYGDDYQQPPEHSLKKVPVLHVAVPEPPVRARAVENTGSASATISLVFKSLKPPASFTLSVQPTDSIASIKAQLATQPTAPPVDAQRLLLKGKALADNKLLKEYTNIKDGDTVNLIIKPGFHWDPTKPPAPAPTTPTTTTTTTTTTAALPVPTTEPVMSSDHNKFNLTLKPTSGKPSGRHQRIPSVVLSPSPSSEHIGQPEKDILLTLDQGSVPASLATETLTSYHATVSKPEFWEKLHVFLKSEFATEDDALTAWEDFLRASKGSLTASEIAKIRDQVGVKGMAGT